MKPPTIYQAAIFLRRHGAGPARWPADRLMHWLRFHWANGGVGVVRERGRVVACGVARCVDSIDQAQLFPYAHEEKGAVLWCDELASRHPDGIGLLLEQARKRFGPRQSVCGSMFDRPGQLRMLPWTTVEKIIQRSIPHHGLPRHTGATGRA